MPSFFRVKINPRALKGSVKMAKVFAKVFPEKPLAMGGLDDYYDTKTGLAELEKSFRGSKRELKMADPPPEVRELDMPNSGGKIRGTVKSQSRNIKDRLRYLKRNGK